ncbi:MAG TPA: flagellar filament capping protein FliD [Dongiaceae bacterium]|jgi:flagellar hook-associated protein 2|nr:flagellar filament capping protein FliD [Dongiaceae bacterium]
MAVSSISSTGSSYTSQISGFDSAALIEAAVNQKLQPADRIETNITEEQARLAAYQTLKSLLDTLSTSLDALRNRGGSESDAFEGRSVYLSASGDSAASDVIGATVDSSAAIGSHQIEITQIATAHKIGSADLAARDTALGYDGTFTIAAGDRDAVEIAVTDDMTLNDIAAAINATTEESGVSASILKVSDDDYIMVISGTETGETMSLADETGSALADLGILDTSGAIAGELQAAQDAILTVDGVEVTRSSNEIDDLIDGVDLYLYAADEGNTITIEVGQDLDGIKSAIEDFVTAYNAVRDFVLQQQTVETDGGADDDAVLFGDSLLRSLSSDLQALLSSASTEDGRTLVSSGLSFDSDNKLSLDSDALDTALLQDPAGIAALFEFQAETSSSDLQVLRNGTGDASQDFTIDITIGSDGAISAASVGGDSSLFTISGSRLIGAEGTAYEGMVLVFAGSQSTSIDVGITRGVAELLSTAVSKYIDDNAGTLDAAIDTSTARISDMENKISEIEQRADDYKTWLTNYYGQIEAKITRFSLLKDQLEALLNGSNDDN